ncbi:MAG: radical SAM protein [Elusimicrobiota bacterium]
MIKRSYTSRYLNIINLDDGKTSLLFNGVNGCLDEVPKELGDILSSRDQSQLGRLSPANLDFLARRGHITALPPDTELGRFKEFVAGLYNQQSKQSSTGGIILLVSYDCNLACKYCYQQKHRPANSGTVMPLTLVDDIFEKHLPVLLPGIHNPCLSLYGGEPFLPSTEAVIRRAMSHAKKQPDMAVVAVTNGTMVDTMLDVFGPGPGKVNKVQISLDGARHLHNKSRVPASGKATFDKILSNIQLLLKQDIHVDIRLNVDRNKIESLPQLLEELKSKKIIGNKLVTVYTYPLHESIADVEAADFISLGDVSRKMRELGIDMECPSSLRTTDMQRLFTLEKGVALTRSAYCMQTFQHYLVVDPFANVYACSEEAGYPEYRVGHISDMGVDFFPLRDIYKTRHLANLPECLACSVALACGGQCGMNCRAKTGNLFKPYCDDVKSVILAGLKLAYKQRLTKKTRTQNIA